MTFLGGIIKNGIKVVGLASQVGIEMTSDIVGKVKEGILREEGYREELSRKGKDLGETIKSNIDKVSEKAEDIINEGVKSTSRVARDITSVTLSGLNNITKVAHKGTEDLKNKFEKYSNAKDAEQLDNKYIEQKVDIIIDVYSEDMKSVDLLEDFEAKK